MKILNEIDSRQYLERENIPFNKYKFVRHKDELSAAAEGMDFPLVMKIISPKLNHKSDLGGVILNIRNFKELSQAWDDLESRMAVAKLSEAVVGASVQEQINGLEMFVGLKRDETFGPVLAVGAGGILVELVGDINLGICPLVHGEALDLINTSKAGRLFAGYRGKPPFDKQAFADLLVALSQTAMKLSDWQEMDLNPVIVRENGKGTCAVDARIVLAR